ncbi:hypothetical protein BJY01DRAFT_254638 [Aspergillus pseudoustus]|uniref:Uncharacterized protein n=1 Tax=Aspergillus pseudoustus TaxID=1810923 RepID=A0ABR4IRL6_9EURO
MGIEINGPGLKYETLSANIIHCANVGNDTFRETAENMELLAELTCELSQPDGIIDKMLEFSEPGQSKDRDELLADIIAQGEESIIDCTNAIEKVSASFNGWCTLTKALHLALRDTLGRKQREEKNLEDEINKHEADKELKEEQKRKEEARMKEKHEQMQKTREKKEWYENNVEKIVMRGGMSAILASAPEIISITPVLVAVGAAAFVHYVTLKADLSSMEDAQAKRDQEIRELEESKTHLELALVQLSKESKSIDEVAKIVERSISRVTELQQLTQRFMGFLRDMNRIISYSVRRSKRVYSGFKKKDSFVDPEIFKNAFDMKIRFIFASKASNVYNAVSSQYILPTLDVLPGLYCLNQASDHEIQAKIDDLHKMRCRVSSETGFLTRKMHNELKESLVEVTRASSRAFEELLLKGQDATA